MCNRSPFYPGTWDVSKKTPKVPRIERGKKDFVVTLRKLTSICKRPYQTEFLPSSPIRVFKLKTTPRDDENNIKHINLSDD